MLGLGIFLLCIGVAVAGVLIGRRDSELAWLLWADTIIFFATLAILTWLFDAPTWAGVAFGLVISLLTEVSVTLRGIRQHLYTRRAPFPTLQGGRRR